MTRVCVLPSTVQVKDQLGPCPGSPSAAQWQVGLATLAVPRDQSAGPQIAEGRQVGPGFCDVFASDRTVREAVSPGTSTLTAMTTVRYIRETARNPNASFMPHNPDVHPRTAAVLRSCRARHKVRESRIGRCLAVLRLARDGPDDRFGGDAMNMTDKTRNVLRATGNLLAQTLGGIGKASAVRSSGGLTSAAEGSDSIMVAGSPGRRVAGSPGRRVAGSPGRRVAGSPGRRVAGSPGRRVAGSPGRRVAGSPGRPTYVLRMGTFSPASLSA